MNFKRLFNLCVYVTFKKNIVCVLQIWYNFLVTHLKVDA